MASLNWFGMCLVAYIWLYSSSRRDRVSWFITLKSSVISLSGPAALLRFRLSIA